MVSKKKTSKKYSLSLDNFIRYLNFIYYFTLKKERLTYPPLGLMIEPTNFCNIKCAMCPQSGLMIREKGYMDFSLFKKIIDEAKDFVQYVQLFHTGESLIHPRIFEMIEYANKANIYTMIHTNGILVKGERAQKLLTSGLDYLSFSYEAIRNENNYQKNINNILTFLKMKSKKEKPFTAIEVIKMKNSVDNIDNVRLMFKNTNLNLFRIRQFANWGESQFDNLSSSEVKDTPVYPCEFPFQLMGIHWNGDVIPCCLDYDAKYILGNVKHDSVLNIWNNNPMRNLRNVIKRGAYKDIELCRNCSFLKTSKSYYTIQGICFKFYSSLIRRFIKSTN